jgi:hypothetical protein
VWIDLFCNIRLCEKEKTMSQLFCFLLIFGQIAAFVYFDPVYASPPRAVVSEEKRDVVSIYGNSILLHLPQKSG